MRCSSITARSLEHSIQSILVFGLLQSVSAAEGAAYTTINSTQPANVFICSPLQRERPRDIHSRQRLGDQRVQLFRRSRLQVSARVAHLARLNRAA